MSISVNWKNPYADRNGQWLRGNLHAHTSPASGCGQVKIERVLELYEQKGLDFLSISDHMVLTEPLNTKLIMIPGTEWNSVAGEHTGIYTTSLDLIRSSLAIRSHEELLNHLKDKDVLVILNHPNWEIVPHYRREQLEQKENYDAIEIYNGVIERLAGYAISTDKWDYLLVKGRRVLGFASDDSHQEDDIGEAWNCVRAAEPTPQGILNALRTGNFYCSTGVVFRDIRMEDGVITVESDNAQEIRVDTERGIFRRTREKCMQLDIDEVLDFERKTQESVKGSPWEALFRNWITYVRFTAFGEGSSMAWTQPFFIK